jgi:formylglycine-generating enzyme required for sulfatase activity
MPISAITHALLSCGWLALATSVVLGQQPRLSITQKADLTLLTFRLPVTNGTITILQGADLCGTAPWTLAYVAPVCTYSGQWTLPHSSRTGFFKLVLNPNPVPDSMVWIAPGTFLMGSPTSDSEAKPDEFPQHEVTIAQGFWICKFEVTQQEYEDVMGVSNNRSLGKAGPNAPVDSVSWFSATNYCGKLTEREQALGRLPTGYVYRLPTEAEWEYACRADTQTRYTFGDDLEFLDNNVWWAGNGGSQPHPVGQKPPNAWGLFDMLGNVFEWCLDSYLPYPGSAAGTDSNLRNLRGGAFFCPLDVVRSACRNHATVPETRSALVGFRAVLGPTVPDH